VSQRIDFLFCCCRALCQYCLGVMFVVWSSGFLVVCVCMMVLCCVYGMFVVLGVGALLVRV